ncbi:UNVERIFIED_CONTAM: hypothetical protein FKN15_065259 [Acipenser sinensis]
MCCPPKHVPSADRFFSHCRLTMQIPQSYSVGGKRSSQQLTGEMLKFIHKGPSAAEEPAPPTATANAVEGDTSTSAQPAILTQTHEIALHQLLVQLLKVNEMFKWMKGNLQSAATKLTIMMH